MVIMAILIIFQLGQWGREGGRVETRDNVCSRIYIGIFLLTDWHQWSGPVIIKTIIVSLIDHSQSFHHHTGINSNCYFYHHHHHVLCAGLSFRCYNYFNKAVSVRSQGLGCQLPTLYLRYSAGKLNIETVSEKTHALVNNLRAIYIQMVSWK